MSSNAAHEVPDPIWWVSPGDTDWFAWAGIITIAAAVYLVVTLYAKFDHWAEHKSEGTPLAKTIPTLLTIALLYEVFPLGHFSMLLPLTAILIAVMADWMAAQAKHDLSSVDSTDALVHELETVREIVQEEQGKPQPAADEALDDEVLAEKDELDTGESKNA